MTSARVGPAARRLKSIVGGSVGNLVEWYDWYVYSAFALYFAKSFFPPASISARAPPLAKQKAHQERRNDQHNRQNQGRGQ